jgi:hypothetical protein
METYATSITVDTSITARSVVTTRITALCSVPTTYNFATTPPALPTQSFVTGSLTPINYTIGTSDFILTSICADTEFYYKASLFSTTATIPVAWAFDPEQQMLSWGTATNANVGVYVISISNKETYTRNHSRLHACNTHSPR